MKQTIVPLNLLFLCFLTLSITACYASEEKQTNEQKEDISQKQDNAGMVETTVEDTFDSVIENLKSAIENRGLLISGTMHISDMLNRTGKDMGIEKNIYKHAEGIEFCSASLSHKMAQVHPNNISACPFTIVAYQFEEGDDKIRLSYQKTVLSGDGEKVEAEITKLLEGIVEETSSW